MNFRNKRNELPQQGAISMRLRLTKIDAFQFLTCIKQQVWGNRSARFKNWKEGDYPAFQVDEALAGLAQISGKPYVSDEVVWDNGLFSNRIPIKLLNAALPENRVPFLGDIGEALISAWGNSCGWGILNQMILPEADGTKIIDSIKAGNTDLNEVKRNLEIFLSEARVQRNALSKKNVREQRKKNKQESESSSQLMPSEEISPKDEVFSHAGL